MTAVLVTPCCARACCELVACRDLFVPLWALPIVWVVDADGTTTGYPDPTVLFPGDWAIDFIAYSSDP